MSCSLTSTHSNPQPIVSYTSPAPPGLGLPATMSWGLPSMAQPIPQCVAHVCYLTTHRAPPEAPQETSPIQTRRQDETMHTWGYVWAPKALDSKSHSNLPKSELLPPFPTLGKTVNHNLRVGHQGTPLPYYPVIRFMWVSSPVLGRFVYITITICDDNNTELMFLCI